MDVVSTKPLVVNQGAGSIQNTKEAETKQADKSIVGTSDTVTISDEARLLLEESTNKETATLMNGGGTEPPPPPPIPPKGSEN